MIPAAWVLPLYGTATCQAFLRGLCWNLWIQLTNKQRKKVRRKWPTISLPSFRLQKDSHMISCNHSETGERRLSVCLGRGNRLKEHQAYLCCIHYRWLTRALNCPFYLCWFTLIRLLKELPHPAILVPSRTPKLPLNLTFKKISKYFSHTELVLFTMGLF